MEKEDRSSSQVGVGTIVSGTPGSFLSMQHSCKQRDMWPQVGIQSPMQEGLWLFLQWFPGRVKFLSLEPRKLPQCGSQPEWEGLPDPLAGHSAEQQECFHCQGHLLGRFFPWSLPPGPIFYFLDLSLGCSLMSPLPSPPAKRGAAAPLGSPLESGVHLHFLWSTALDPHFSATMINLTTGTLGLKSHAISQSTRSQRRFLLPVNPGAPSTVLLNQGHSGKSSRTCHPGVTGE